MGSKKLAGKVSLVTGAGQGLGESIAMTFAEEGAIVIVNDINFASASKVVEKIQKLNGNALAISADVSKSDEVGRMVTKVLETFGRIDILVNNAGISPKKAFGDYTEQDWDNVLDINLKGAYLCARAVSETMIKQKYGKIVNMSSSAMRTGGQVAGAPYAASKAGMYGLTKSLARVLGPYNINANAVTPGIIDTPLTRQYPPEKKKAVLDTVPLGRIGTAEDVAKAVLFLVSDDSSYITGVCLDINGGFYMA